MKSRKLKLNSLLLFLISLISHLPFLWAGYGREEDAWAQALNAKMIWESGLYEVSRLPGHPLYELLLALLWPLNSSYFFFNLLSALASALAVVIFYRSATRLDLKRPFELSVAFAFIPVFFIAGNYTIDYNFALLFILSSFLLHLKRRFWLAGILLGIATGFRISSLGFLLPFLIFFWPRERSLKPLLISGLVALGVALLSFSPAWLIYGWGFLDFHKPPFPSLANILYKMSFGIWGIPLLVYLLIASLYRLVYRRESRLHEDRIPSRAMWAGVIVIAALQLAVFLRLPFKSEFFIPLLPFLFFLVGAYFSGRQIRGLAFAALASCFLLGFDYASDQRGAKPSAVHWSFTAGGKQVYLDLLQGPALIDRSKRLQKSEFIEDVQQHLKQLKSPSVLIAGWYWPELMLKFSDTGVVKLRYYLTAEEMRRYDRSGRQIFYLPEIDEANAKVRGHYLADSLAQPLFRP